MKKAICMDRDCDYSLDEKVFNVKSIPRGKCPNCDSKKIAPAWVKDYKLPREEELRLVIIERKKRLKQLEQELVELEAK